MSRIYKITTPTESYYVLRLPDLRLPHWLTLIAAFVGAVSFGLICWWLKTGSAAPLWIGLEIYLCFFIVATITARGPKR